MIWTYWTDHILQVSQFFILQRTNAIEFVASTRCAYPSEGQFPDYDDVTNVESDKSNSTAELNSREDDGDKGFDEVIGEFR